MARKTITIDPVTRIEGHLNITVDIEDGKVVDARSSGTMFRGIEIIMKGRDPRDAQVIPQRACGVCPTSHGLAAAQCLDSVYGVEINDNARIIRNLILASNYMQSHVLHFYHLAALDYVAGPEAAPFIPRYEGDYRLPKEVNDACVAHYLQALDIRMKAHELEAIFSGKMPHQVTYVPGGVTVTPNVDDIAAFLWRLRQIKDFVDNVYVPDVLAVADVYKDYAGIGKGYGNFLSYGLFDMGKGKPRFLKAGHVTNNKEGDVDQEKITECVTNSWYTYSDGSASKHPQEGETNPDINKKEGYTWAKAPRYDGIPHEVGPLARMYVNGDYRDSISVIGRHAARALEAKKIAAAMEEWILQVKPGQPAYTKFELKKEGMGFGLVEASRGALGHWIKVSKGKIENYQMVVPTTWNCSPRDDKGQRGPIEEALIGTAVKDTANPIEVVRVIRSFDPCLGCTVHIVRAKHKITKFRAC